MQARGATDASARKRDQIIYGTACSAYRCCLPALAGFCGTDLHSIWPQKRKEGDSNPRYLLGTHAFQACTLNHSDIFPRNCFQFFDAADFWYRKEGDSNPRYHVTGITVFETARFDRSRIFPRKNASRLKNLYEANTIRTCDLHLRRVAL